jgi:transcriptional regulator with XRE-family HTH domain
MGLIEGSHLGRTVQPSTGDPTPLTTGQRLSKLISDSGLTSRELAEHLGIQESTLANFRGGHRGIPSHVVAAMARELDTNVSFLLEHSEDPRPQADILEETQLREEAYRGALT